nr:hypothetical protein [Tanacetum cinerariifolium]
MKFNMTYIRLISTSDTNESVGLSPSRIILFGTILANILVEIPTIPPVIPTLPHTSPFLCTNSSKNSSDSSKRPPSHDPYEVIVAQWMSRVAVRLSPPSSPTHDLPPTVRHILHALPGFPCRPTVLILPDYSPSVHFSSNDSSSDSSSGHSLPDSSFLSEDSSFDTPATISTKPSRKMCRSHIALVPLATPTPGALSLVRANLLPPCKRIRGVVTASDYDDSTEGIYEPCIEPDIDSDV